MSDFTSWGTSPDLRFKPEVTAPGGQIYSTVNDNRYESMSGTSMAAPHAAGGVALVVQYLKSKKVELKEREFVNLAKTLLINTAKPQIEKETNLSYLTRRQGAGLVQIYDAIKTNVSAVDQKGGAAIALGELKNENKFTLKENWAWDGTLFNDRTGKHEEAPEGQYYIKTSGKVDYPGAREQEVVMPIKIDKTAPTINPELTKLEGNNYRVKFNANDNMKVCYKMIIVNGDYTKPLAVLDKYDELGVVLPSGFNLVSVVATDFAGNFSEQKDFYINNTFIDIYPEWEKPYIFLTNSNLDIEYIVNNLFTGLGKLNVTLDDKITENLPLYGRKKE